MRGLRIAGSLLGLALAAPLWGEGTPYLLADIHRGPAQTLVKTGPSGFFELGGRLFFSTANPESFDQGILWSTDGTSRGTVQVSSSLCVARCTEITPLATGNGLVWLRIAAGKGASETFYRLARTDGTPAGTFVVTGLLSPYDSLPEVHILPGAGLVFFSACSYDCTLWRSDGTRSGTGPFPGTDGQPFYDPRSFTVWRNRLYFVASREAEGGEPGLWSTDGTVQGTRFVHSVGDLGNNRPDPPVVTTPSHLFFVSGPTNEDLLATDGTAEGSRLLADFPPVGCEDGCELPDVYTLAAFGDAVYFETPKTDAQRARIWRSDGTPEGTRPAIDLPARIEGVENLRRIGGHWIFAARIHEWDPRYPWTVDDGFTHVQPLGTCGGEPCPSVYDLFATPLSGLGLLQGYGSDSGSGLWVTDGTGPGTRRLSGLCDLLPSPLGGPDFVPSPDGRRLYLQGCPDDEGKGELWVTDGTPEGTHRAGGLFSGVGFLNGRAYYGVKPPDRPTAEIWSADDAPNGERRVAVLRRFRAGSEPWFQPLGKGVVFSTTRQNGQAGLWRSDGTRAGTVPLYEFPAGHDWYIADFVPLGKSLQVFWVYRSPLDGYGSTPELWRTDGTAGGTRFVAPFEEGDYLYGGGTPWNGRAVFAVLGSPDCSLWSTDGTSPGTRRLDLLPALGCPWPVTALGSRLLFVAPEKHSRRPIARLFASDGTRAGTVPIARFEGNVRGSEAVVAGGAAWINVVYRDEHDNDVRSEIWRTDGTAAGTRLAATLLRAENLYPFGDSLYLTVEEEEPGEPGISDGQALYRIPLAGGEPVRLARVTEPPVYFLDAMRYAPLGGRLAFMTFPWFADGSRDFWVTDGTPEGTHRIRRFLPWPGIQGIFPIEDLVSSGSKVYFPAGDGSHGRELWESDGTPEGTRMVVDLAPGGLSGIPESSSLAINNGVLFFSADDGKSGPEPWALRLP